MRAKARRLSPAWMLELGWGLVVLFVGAVGATALTAATADTVVYPLLQVLLLAAALALWRSAVADMRLREGIDP